MKWKSGAFESLPAEPGHIQTIAKSLEALLLESTQAVKKAVNPTPAQEEEETMFITRLTAVAYEGAEFVVTVPVKKEDSAKGWGMHGRGPAGRVGASGRKGGAAAWREVQRRSADAYRGA